MAQCRGFGMSYRFSEQSGTVTVTFTGQMNFTVNVEFRELLANIVEKRPQAVVFDLSELTMIDSVGLGLLYIAQEDIAAVGAKLSLARPRDKVARLLELTEASKTFEIIL
jgi:anti-anti-sigma factor